PTVTMGRDAPRPVPPALHTVALSGVDATARRTQPVPGSLADYLAAARGLSPAVAARRAADVAPAVLTARTSTDQFSMLGVTWLPSPTPVDLVASVRTRTDGSWTGWKELEQLADTASGDELAASTRMGTAPRWVGDSDGVQVRVDVVVGRLPDGLRIDLVDPGTSPADDDIDAAPPASSAAAAAARPPIITRAQWGADESLRDRNLAMSRTIKASFVHHTAGSNSYTRAQAPAVVRGLLAYSTGSVGYADIPYNFLVDKFGRIYEGRAGSITGSVRQAATGGFNTDTMSVVAMGNFVSKAAPDVMVDGISRILAFRLSTYHRNPMGTKVLVTEDGPSRYTVGQKVKFNVISGHRDAGYTACPGTRLYQRLPEIRRTVKRLMGANFVEPGLSTHRVAYGDATAVTARSRSLTAMDWQLTVTRVCQNTVVQTRTGTVAPGSPLKVLWRGRDDQGRQVPAGRYLVTLSGASATSQAVTWKSGVQIQVGSPAPPATTSLLAGSPVGRYVAVTPRKLAATSGGFGLAAPVLLGADSRIRVPVLGRGGVPSSNVSAVAVNVLASCAGRDTSLSVGPSTVRSGDAFAVSVDGGESARGLAVSGIGPDGAITIRNSRGTVSAAVSVVGYWTTAGGGDGFVPLSPTTLPGTASGLPVGPTPVTLDVAGKAGVPSGADAAVVNVRRRSGGSASAVWVWAANAGRPSMPSLRRSPGQAAQQRVVVPLSGDGRIKVAADQPARVTLDVVGYLSGGGAGFHPVAPRLVTSNGLRVGAGQSSRTTVGGVAGVPKSADAVVLQLSGSQATRGTRLFVYPAGATVPAGADLSVPRRATRTNLVVVPLGAKGRVKVRNADSAADVSLVVMGWFG
ncbi:MAG TPA: N-acetylmuramoyl-L-alanine amidase, partial [Actinomycetes bacterium]|nr:N-acetylmuramoyl-L-alanine amidase [Actinomycetes bacterium]